MDLLASTFYRVVYPILPYFHWPTFSARVRARHYERDRAFFAFVMAVCAITSARMRDGVGTPLPPDAPLSEAFFDAALSAFPADLTAATDFDYKRAKAILAILSLQYGQVRQLSVHLGDYMTMCAADGFHNENRWPPNLPVTEIQERRRVFWGVYSIDVYAACTWGGIVRHRETQANVLYPAEVWDDSEITETGIAEPAGVSFLRGWNFTNDLYRILEHALGLLRQRKLEPTESQVNRRLFSLTRLNSSFPSSKEVLDTIQEDYNQLPVEFKGAQAMTGNVYEDRFGFQAADIIVTMQTVKMVMTGLEDASVEKRCAIAGELLDALSTVPTAYIQAISSPILHHLAGVGHLLGSVIQTPLSHWTYLQVRNVLLAMADLLSSLESTMSFTPGIAEKLRDHVKRIDQYMTAAAVDRSRRAQVWHTALPPSAWQYPNTPGVGSGGDSSVRTTEEPQKQEEQVIPGNLFDLPLDLLTTDWPLDMRDAFDFLGPAPAINPAGVQGPGAQ